MSKKRSNKESLNRNISILILLSIVVTIVYYPTLGFDFAYDDFTHIHKNTLVTQQEFSFSQVLAHFKGATYPGDLYRPLVTISYYIQYIFSEKNPLAYHLLNIIFHSLNGYLLFCLIARFFSQKIAALTAILFVVSPINIEAVANIAGRPELLAFMFGIGATILILDNLNFKFNLIGSLLLLLACLSKENAIIFTLLIPLVCYSNSAFESNSEKAKTVARTRTALIFSVVPVLIALGCRYLVLGTKVPVYWEENIYHPENPFQYISFLDRIYPALVYLGHYLSLMSLPFPLSADYSTGLRQFWQDVLSLQGTLYFLVLSFWLSVSLYFRKQKIALFLFWPLISFLITCNLLIPIGTVMGERLCYLPGLGVSCFLSFLILEKISSKHIRRLIVLGISVLYLSIDYYRLPVWSNDLTLFNNTYYDAPYSPKPSAYLASYWIREYKDYTRAKPYLMHMYELDHTNLYSQKLLLHTALEEKNFPEAVIWSQRIIKLDPNDAIAREILIKLTGTKSTFP